MSQDPYKRNIRNLLLQPTLQMRIGLVSILVAVTFCVLILGLIFTNLQHFYNLVLDLTGLEQEVSKILGDYIQSLAWAIFGLVTLYLAASVYLSIYYTHRLVGPTIAFRRHIRSLIDGNMESRVNLRKNDAFTEVADDLNELAEVLQKKQTSSKHSSKLTG